MRPRAVRPARIRGGQGRHVVGGEGLLQRVGDVVHVGVLHVEDVPGADRGAAVAFDHGEQAACVVDIARIACHDQHRIDAGEGQDLHDLRQGAAAAVQGCLQDRRHILGISRFDREQGVGLAAEPVDVEGVDDLDQRVAGRRGATCHMCRCP